MALLDIIYRGGDYEPEFVLEEADGTPLDISLLTGLIIAIYSKSDGMIMGKYTKNAITGFNDADFIYASGNTFKIKLQAEVTRLFTRDCVLLFEIKIRRSNVNYSNSGFDSFAKDEVLATFKNTILGTQEPM